MALKKILERFLSRNSGPKVNQNTNDYLSQFLSKLGTGEVTKKQIAEKLYYTLRQVLEAENFRVSEIFIAWKDDFSPKTSWKAQIGNKNNLAVPLDYEKIQNTPRYFCYSSEHDSEKIQITFLPFLLVIDCTSVSMKARVEEIFKVLKPVLIFALSQDFELRKLKYSNKNLRKSLIFPRGSDDIVAYEILRPAQQISPYWLNLSFWRFSRTKDAMKKIAEYNNPKRSSVDYDSIENWGLPSKIKTWEDPNLKENVVSFPQFAIAHTNSTVSYTHLTLPTIYSV